MLKGFFQWSDTHPASYWLIATVPTLLWLGWIAHGLWRNHASRPVPRKKNVAFALLLFGVLLAWRWPFLLSATELGNPDESQLVAGAITLSHDPVFYRAVDGTTSGPLNFYALLPTHWLGIPQDYFNARFTGLLLLWGGMLATQSLLTLAYGTALARLAMTPGVLFLASATDTDFIHYTSEHVSLFLIPAGWWLLWRYRDAPLSGRPSNGWLLAALTAGLLPWAKLQSSLFAAALILWSGWLLVIDQRLSWGERGRRFVWMVAGASAPSILALGVVAATGQREHFVHSYLLENVSFIGGVDFPVWGVLKHLSFICSFRWQFPVYLAGALFLIVGGALALPVIRKRPDTFWYIGLFLTVVACATVIAPRRAHQHYLLYLVFPLTVWAGATVAQLWKDAPDLTSARRMLACAMIVVLQVIAGCRIVDGVPFIYGRLLSDWRQPYTETSILIREHARAGDTLALWGWQPWIFVETGLPHGTRDSHTKSQIESSLQADYFRRRFLDDLERNRPVFFVDAVGHGGRAFAYHDRGRQGYEAFPELRDYVHKHYGSMHEIGSLRLFMRFDRHPHTSHLPAAD